MTKKRKAIAMLCTAFFLLAATAGGVPQYGNAGQTAAAENKEAAKPAAAGELEDEYSPETATGDRTEPAVSSASPALLPAQTGEKKLTPITAVTKALENGKFELLIDERTGNLRIVDKTTGRQWLGAPQLESTAMPNAKKFTEVPVHIRYTEGADITQAYPLKDKDSSVKATIAADHVKVHVEFKALQLAFDMEYRLTADGFEVTIPESSIQERGKAKLTSLEPLPFFHAATERDQGAMMMPDGSGAIMEFRENHPAYLRGYSESIYGSDPTFVTQNHNIIEKEWVHALPPKESIALPVFGIYRNGTGYLAIVTSGETDAKINGTPAGVRALNLYRASTEFTLRKNDVIFVGNSGQIPYYQGAIIKGDRSVRYVLLEGEEANYVGMAKAYRNYLVKEQGVKPVAAGEAALQIKVLGGILRDEIIGSTFIPMTTFEQVRKLIDDYTAQGVKKLELTLDGWSKGGLYGNQPEHFPVDRHLGGEKDLKDLQQYAKSKGVSLYLSANYVRAYSNSDGMKKGKDAVRSINQEVLKHYNYYIGSPWNKDDEVFYLMKPQRVMDKHVSEESSKFAALGVDGVHFKYFGNMLYSDLDNKSELSRHDTANVYRSALDLFRQQVGHAAVDYGFGYTLGHVDRIDNAPMDSSQFVYMDKAVPFYQLVVHGLVPYSSSPANLYDDSRNQALRAIEYGALPSYELTAEPTSKLQRTMEDRLLSSASSDWLAPSSKEYLALKKLYDSVQNEPMVNHEELQPKVFRTTYANGVAVLVNYNPEDVTVGGHTVSAQSYLVIGG